MLFNSPIFLFVYLPVVMLGYFALRRIGWRAVIGGLSAASVFFYAWWDPARIWPMALSILVNYGFGLALMRTRDGQWGTAVLIAGVVANLGFLGWFKYAGFVATNLSALMGQPEPMLDTFLPLGISFFTFTQLAYLVDARRGETSDTSFLRYILFVTFFPHLIAGPIIHHKEMMPQFSQPRRPRIAEDVVVGLTLFVIGLFKKTVLADSLAEYASPIFSAAGSGQAIGALPAWQGALAYTGQIYLDFSGYSDMAVGLARMVGIDLPVNFNSPYKARSIIDFWRRWHITLSRFLRDYLYLPLGGNRKGPARRYVNLTLVMLLGGLWHGANWTFVAWGGLHGAFLVINHLWRDWRGARPLGELGRLAGWGATMGAVIVAWVFFRADTLDGALTLLAAMFGGNGLTGADPSLFAAEGLALALGLLAVCALAPNSQQIMRHFQPGLEPVDAPTGVGVCWTPSARWAVVTALLAVVAVTHLWSGDVFLYYQF